MDYATTYPLAGGKRSILDLDADEYGNFIALLDSGEVWTATWRIRLAQRFQYPLIRVLNKQQFVILEARRRAASNGFIFTNDGHQVAQFNAGDGIEDVLVQAGQLVIAYFDEGVMSNQPPSRDGLALFDFAGRQLFGFNSSLHPFIVTCYCLGRQGKNELLACAYPDFPLLELNLNTHRLTTLPTPSSAKGAHAISSFQQWLIFYNSPPYQPAAGFVFWDRKARVHQLPFSLAQLRGIGNGKFLSYDTTIFTILDAMLLLEQHGLTT